MILALITIVWAAEPRPGDRGLAVWRDGFYAEVGRYDEAARYSQQQGRPELVPLPPGKP